MKRLIKLLKKVCIIFPLVLVCLCVFGGFTIPEDGNEQLVTVYCTDGRLLNLSEEDAQPYIESQDWSDDFGHVVSTVWNTAGESLIVLNGKLEVFLGQGWSDDISSVTVLMENDTEQKQVFKDLVEDYKEDGWKESSKKPVSAKGKNAVSGPAIAFTFDDGPHSNYTNLLLNILELYDIRATFFMLGSAVEKNPETVKRMQELGMEFGSHSYSHKQLTKISEAELTDEIYKTSDAIEDITGEAPTLFRPPYGSYNDTVKATAGVPIVLWSLDTLDWKSRNPYTIYDDVMSQVRDGSVLLFHDIYPTTVTAIEKLIPALQDKGYDIVTVSELAERKGKELAPGQVFSQGY